MKNKILVMSALAVMLPCAANAAVQYSISTSPNVAGNAGSCSGDYTGGATAAGTGTLMNSSDSSSITNSSVCAQPRYYININGSAGDKYYFVTCAQLTTTASQNYQLRTKYINISSGLSSTYSKVPCWFSYQYPLQCASSYAGCTASSGDAPANANHIVVRTSVTCSCESGRTEAKAYLCENGYYGNPTSATSGCTKCPDPTDKTVSSSALKTGKTGAKTVSECYILANSSFSDSTGSGTITSTCKY